MYTSATFFPRKNYHEDEQDIDHRRAAALSGMLTDGRSPAEVAVTRQHTSGHQLVPARAKGHPDEDAASMTARARTPARARAGAKTGDKGGKADSVKATWLQDRRRQGGGGMHTGL